MERSVIITVGIVTAIALVVASVTSFTIIEENPFKQRKLLETGMSLPVIWVYLDDSDVNSRSWLDFMGRSTRAINLPFLNLCYQTIVLQNKGHYRVEVISGISDLAARVGGELPTPLQRPQVSMGVAEKTWIRSAILKKYGGLWLEPSSIAIAPFGKLPEKVVFFGTDADETYSGPSGTPAPGLRCIWSPKPEHPLFVKWEAMARERLETQFGGKNFRGDEKWDVRQLASEFSGDIEYQPHMELSRKSNGKRIQLDDLLMSGQQGILPFDVQKQSKYVTIPWPELRSSRKYGWFLKMNEEQIMESDLVITDMFRISIR
jgi:hypothetical protein